jgi:hypothetical protein
MRIGRFLRNLTRTTSKFMMLNPRSCVELADGVLVRNDLGRGWCHSFSASLRVWGRDIDISSSSSGAN